MGIVSQFFRELRRRGVLGTTAIYVVAAWVLVQVASEAFPAFDISEFAIRYVWIGVALGFPFALIVGWMYDISTHGINRTPQTGSDEGTGIPLKRFDFLVLSGIAVVAVGLVFILLGRIMNLQEPVLVQTTARELDPNSEAVLPLDNFTGDPDQAYFVAALHEALTAGLTSISALKVISRTSASAFVDTAKTLPEIGRELRVANIIEGSVFRSGNRVRITVQLINALTDEHLWAENYEREMVDLLALQGEVTRAIANQIQVTLTPMEDSRLSSKQKVDPEIHELYLKGMYFLKQYKPGSLKKGLRYLHQAVELDPGNARAYAGLALGYNTIGHGIVATHSPRPWPQPARPFYWTIIRVKPGPPWPKPSSTKSTTGKNQIVHLNGLCSWLRAWIMHTGTMLIFWPCWVAGMRYGQPWKKPWNSAHLIPRGQSLRVGYTWSSENSIKRKP